MGKTELGGGDSLGESSNSVTRGLLRDLVLVLVALLQALVFFMLSQNEIERKDMRAQIARQQAEISGLQERTSAQRTDLEDRIYSVKERVTRLENKKENQ